MAFDLRRAEPSRPSILAWLIVVPALIYLVLAVCVSTGTSAVIDLDERVADWAYDISADNKGFETFLEVVAIAFSNQACSVVLVLMAGYSLYRRERAVAAWIVTSGIVVIAGNALLKLLYERDRPVFEQPLYEPGGYSFPSGHSSGAAMFFTVAIFMTIIVTGRGFKRRIPVTILALMAVGVGASRIFLGVHYLSDVVAGLSFGLAATVGLWVLMVSSRARSPHELATATGSGRRRVAVVLNPVKVGPVDDFKARVRMVAQQFGWSEPVWFETSIEDPGHGQATAALHEGVDLIIAAGGDGTVRNVCEEVARTGVAVGVLPHGTGNLLARNLGIPLNNRDALEVAFGGQDRAIDLSTLETDSGANTTFMVMAGLGMDAAIMTGVNDQLKSRVGWLAYFVSGIKSARFPAMKVQISVDDQEFRKFKARTVVVGNVGFLQGGIPLLPDAQIDDGLLDVVVIAPKRFIGWLAIIVRVIGRQKRTNERLDRLTGQKVVIKTEKPVPMQLDGDPVGDGQMITAQVQPGVLLVRVPVAPAAAI